MIDFEHLYNKFMHIAYSINEMRTDMRSSNKCVAIYLDNRIPVSIGANKSKTHPMLLKFDYHKYKYFSTENIDKSHICKSKRPQYPIHAELDGYIKLLNSGADFNILLLYRGDKCNLASEPCYVCSNWLRRINKLTICFVNKEGNFSSISSEDLIGHHRDLLKSYNTYSFKSSL